MVRKNHKRELAKLVDRLTAAKGHAARKPVRQALRELAAANSSPLTHFLNHHDCFTRWEVINLLGQLRDARVTQQVVDFALAEDELHARWRSFWAVSRFDQLATVPLLLHALDLGEQPGAWRAALILSMLGRKEAETALVAGLDSNDTWVQWEALSAIKALRSSYGVAAVAGFLDRKHERFLRQEAALALGAIGGETARQALEVGLRDHEHEVRWRASSSLSRINDPQSIRVLRTQIRVEKHAQTKQQIRLDLSRMEARHGAP